MAKVKANITKKIAVAPRSAQKLQNIKSDADSEKTAAKPLRTLRVRLKRVRISVLPNASATSSKCISPKAKKISTKLKKLQVRLKRTPMPSTVKPTDQETEQANTVTRRSKRHEGQRVGPKSTNISDTSTVTAGVKKRSKLNRLTLGKLQKNLSEGKDKITAELTSSERLRLEKIVSPATTSLKENALRIHSCESSKKNNENIMNLKVKRNGSNTLSLTYSSLRKTVNKEHEHVNFAQNIVQKQSRVTSPKNLANNSQLIQEILFSEDENENESNKITNVTKPQAPSTVTRNETKKFFHRDIVNLVRSKSNSTNKITVTAKRSNKNSKTKHRTASNCNATVGGSTVYEFLSQSQSSDSETTKKTDPAADIIQRLIKEGRVRVATLRKGRPVVKRLDNAAKKRAVAKASAEVQQKIKQVKNLENKSKKQTRLEQHNELNIDVQDNFAYDDNVDVSAHLRTETDGRATSNSNGTFSRLARSVLLQEADRKENSRNQQLKQRRHLLGIARKFVSTPVKKQPPLKTTNISPIAVSPAPISKPSSPWRVNEDSYLPSVFHFSKNSSNLPSFSSDYIPSSPKKLKSASQQNCAVDAALPQADSVILSTIERSLIEAPSIEVPSITGLERELSSFSSNDSNAENQPPPKVAALNISQGNADENAIIFNVNSQLNPRRAQRHRSPLKAINILEVVTLPTWKPDTKKVPPNGNKNVACPSDKSNEELKDMSMFGFSELIEEEDIEKTQLEDSCEGTTKYDNNSKNQTLHEKLYELRKWRPAVEMYSTSRSPEKLADVFSDRFGRPKTRGIKQMLCSTMINQRPTTSKQALLNTVNNDESSEDDINLSKPNRDSATATDLLFTDPEPELSFDSKNPHRTYLRPLRKKRKMRHHFVLYHNSDSSENDEELHEDNEEHNVSVNGKTKGPKGKRRRQSEEKSNEELDIFATEMNNEFKEVEEYELAVE